MLRINMKSKINMKLEQTIATKQGTLGQCSNKCVGHLLEVLR